MRCWCLRSVCTPSCEHTNLLATLDAFKHFLRLSSRTSYDNIPTILFEKWPMKDVKQPRALETREKILQAAAGLFALKGYHDAKLEEVLETAQVTKGAFFHHFRDREDLGFAVLDWHMDRRRQLLDVIEQELPLAEQAGPLQKVFRRLDAIQEISRRRADCKGGLHHRQHEYGSERLP